MNQILNHKPNFGFFLGHIDFLKDAVRCIKGHISLSIFFDADGNIVTIYLEVKIDGTDTKR